MNMEDVTKHLPEGSRLVWTISPNQMPPGFKDRAQQLYVAPGSVLFFCQFFVKPGEPWTQNIVAFGIFKEVACGPRPPPRLDARGRRRDPRTT